MVAVQGEARLRGGGAQVVHEGARGWLARVGVGHLLVQRSAEGLRDGAVDLAIEQRLVQDRAASCTLETFSTETRIVSGSIRTTTTSATNP